MRPEMRFECTGPGVGLAAYPAEIRPGLVILAQWQLSQSWAGRRECACAPAQRMLGHRLWLRLLLEPLLWRRLLLLLLLLLGVRVVLLLRLLVLLLVGLGVRGGGSGGGRGGCSRQAIGCRLVHPLLLIDPGVLGGGTQQRLHAPRACVVLLVAEHKRTKTI